MKFQFTKNGLRSLEELDKPIKERILKKLKKLGNHPSPLTLAEPIVQEKGLFRFRVGNYRIIVSPNYPEDTLDILRVRHRSIAYEC